MIEGEMHKYKGQVDLEGRPNGIGRAKNANAEYSGLFFDGSPLICERNEKRSLIGSQGYGEYKEGLPFGKSTYS